ncbi:toxin co-regulated pilus biosynthesis Q family protein [Paraburkholderia domus]|uniref:toxin co-regulated pilus biosynthesis Q family protein n=1 Tax=Paraburkholderia domus TaxID=2793075 RepID=UPI001EF0F14C|nr:toxin co-regulated pilus biosynthesis Q family protein [Paraburkholderia domus]
MAISALPTASAYAGNSGVFQPNDDQFGAGWQVLQAPAGPAPTAPVAVAPIAAPAAVAAPIADEPPRYTAQVEPGKPVGVPNASQPSKAATPPAAVPVAFVGTPNPPQPAPVSLFASLAPALIPAADKVPTANSLSSGETVMAAVTSDAMPAAMPVDHTFDLQAGISLEQQLQAWAHDAGWTLTWNLPDDWIVPGNKSYGSDFALATEHVIEQAANNGADIRGDLYPDNRSLVVHQAGALR